MYQGPVFRIGGGTAWRGSGSGTLLPELRNHVEAFEGVMQLEPWLRRRKAAMFRGQSLLIIALVAVVSACAGSTKSSPDNSGGATGPTGGAAANGGGSAVSGSAATTGRTDAGAGGEDQTSIMGEKCDSGHLTACVEKCGDTDVGDKADCMDSRYECPRGLRPAASCPEGSWTGSLATCGPWVKYYECPYQIVCDERFWTCLPANPSP